MGFKRNVVVIASILLIAILIFMFVSFTRGGGDLQFPPIVNRCPDFWDYEPDSGTCKNTFGIKKTDVSQSEVVVGIDFEEEYPSKCDKKEWAIGSGYTWDGISNNSSLNCENEY